MVHAVQKGAENRPPKPNQTNGPVSLIRHSKMYTFRDSHWLSPLNRFGDYGLIDAGRGTINASIEFLPSLYEDCPVISTLDVLLPLEALMGRAWRFSDVGVHSNEFSSGSWML